jgi:L-fucose mutarotase
MLKGIDPILSPDLLHALRAMGHGHEIAIVDANYPCGPQGRIIRLDGVPATSILDAILALMPLEYGEGDGASRMIAQGNPALRLPIFEEFEGIVSRHMGSRVELNAITPDAFKRRAGEGFAIVLSGDRRLYGNIILKKGVVPPV